MALSVGRVNSPSSHRTEDRGFFAGRANKGVSFENAVFAALQAFAMPVRTLRHEPLFDL
jgi:hypothetical protein